MGAILAISAVGLILKSNNWPMRECRLKTFSILSSGGHFCSMRQNYFSIFGKGSPIKHFCDIILKSGHWCRRRCHLKFFFPFLTLAGHWYRRGCLLRYFFF